MDKCIFLAQIFLDRSYGIFLEGREAVMKSQKRKEHKSTKFASVPSIIYKQAEDVCDIRISHHYERSHVT